MTPEGLSAPGAAAALTRAASTPLPSSRRRHRLAPWSPFAARMVAGGVVHWVSRPPSEVLSSATVCKFGWLAPRSWWLPVALDEPDRGLSLVSCKLCRRELGRPR